jgi:glycosyltransferase involved in cell wall biosynthesis
MHASLIFVDPLMLRTKLLMCKNAVTISRYNKRYLTIKYGDQLASKIKVIHCGINLKEFQKVQKEKTDSAVILAVGQLVERKGFQYLVDACHIMKQRGIDFKCYLVGEGEERNLIQDRVTLHKLENEFILLGRKPQENIRDLLQEAAVFVLPSIVTDKGEREGIPVALMEAMAMELPVVSTKIVGVPELIEDGIGGLLVEQRNAEQIASALEYLLKNPQISKEMGMHGREKIRQEFNIDHVPHLFKAIFD